MGRHRDNSDRPRGAYTIGYQKPPEEHRFKPGHKGFGPRRKKPVDMHKMLAKALTRNATVTVNGERKTMAALEVMVHQLVTQIVNNPAKHLKPNLALIQAALASQNLSSFDETGVDYTAEFIRRIERMAENIRLASEELETSPDTSDI